MPDTPHIKRFEEYLTGNHKPDGLNVGGMSGPAATNMMLNDLAEHIEELQRRFDNFLNFYHQDIERLASTTDLSTLKPKV